MDTMKLGAAVKLSFGASRRQGEAEAYQIERVLRCVARMTVSRQATLGNRVSEGVVAFVWGLGGGCIKLKWS